MAVAVEGLIVAGQQQTTLVACIRSKIALETSLTLV
jgi:hypothetical protein